MIIYCFKLKFYQHFVFTKKNTPQICLILHQFNLYVLLISKKNWWRLNYFLALIRSLKNGSFSTNFKKKAEIAILTHILTPREIKKKVFSRLFEILRKDQMSVQNFFPT